MTWDARARRAFDRLGEELSRPSKGRLSMGVDMGAHALPDDVIVRPAPPRVTAAQILKAVAQRYELTLDELQMHSRQRRRVHPRQVAMYLACTLTNLSTPDIGRRIGGEHGKYDHSTVIYGRDKVIERMERQPQLARLVSSLAAELQAAAS